jgi:multisubunit Na+/H+ antiporter MnhF subunit
MKKLFYNSALYTYFSNLILSYIDFMAKRIKVYDDSIASPAVMAELAAAGGEKIEEKAPAESEDSLFPYAVFGLAYFIFIFIALLIVNTSIPENVMLIDRNKFSAYMIAELALFIFIFFSFLYFFGPIKSLKRPFYAAIELRDMFVHNVLSLFTAYGFFIFLNYIAYRQPMFSHHLFEAFLGSGINMHSHDYAFFTIKIVYIILGCVSIHIVGKYFLDGRVSFQYFSLSVLAV